MTVKHYLSYQKAFLAPVFGTNAKHSKSNKNWFLGSRVSRIEFHCQKCVESTKCHLPLVPDAGCIHIRVSICMIFIKYYCASGNLTVSSACWGEEGSSCHIKLYRVLLFCSSGCFFQPTSLLFLPSRNFSFNVLHCSLTRKPPACYRLFQWLITM